MPRWTSINSFFILSPQLHFLQQGATIDSPINWNPPVQSHTWPHPFLPMAPSLSLCGFKQTKPTYSVLYFKAKVNPVRSPAHLACSSDYLIACFMLVNVLKKKFIFINFFCPGLLTGLTKHSPICYTESNKLAKLVQKHRFLAQFREAVGREKTDWGRLGLASTYRPGHLRSRGILFRLKIPAYGGTGLGSVQIFCVCCEKDASAPPRKETTQKGIFAQRDSRVKRPAQGRSYVKYLGHDIQLWLSTARGAFCLSQNSSYEENWDKRNLNPPIDWRV